MTHVGIEAIAYSLPGATKTVAQLHAEGLLVSKPDTLEEFGFRVAHVALEGSASELAVGVGRMLLEQNGIDPSRIGLLIHASALASGGVLEPVSSGPLDAFRFPASRIQDELELTRSNVIGIGQQGCVSLFSALRLGRAVLVAEPGVEAVLCVAADVLPPGSSREMVYNLISDGACAALLSRDTPLNRIVAGFQTTKGAYWDTPQLENEIMASYFPTARMVVDETLKRARLTREQIRWIVPHNVSLRSWELLMRVLDFPREKLFDRNIERHGHTMSADNLVNLKDLMDEGTLSRGDYLLLFTFGFGLNWSCLVLRH